MRMALHNPDDLPNAGFLNAITMKAEYLYVPIKKAEYLYDVRVC